MIADIMSIDTLVLVISIFAAVYGMSMFFYWTGKNRARYEEQSKILESAKLDEYRAHLERQLLELNMKFSSSEKRWQELNHLVVAGQTNNEYEKDADFSRGTELFFKSHGIQLERIKKSDNLLFMLTPFHDDLKDEFETISRVGSTMGLQVLRGDEKLESGDIFRRILILIASARIVVANISGRNPNVFYELGIAHALGKQVILIAQNDSEIPFDVQSKPIVFYRDNKELADGFTAMLGRSIVSSSRF